MNFQELKIKATTYLEKAKLWYLNLDKKKKIILWLYIGCAIVLIVGSISIIFGSVFQADKFDNQAKLNTYLEKTDKVDEKFDQVSKENNLEALEDRTKTVETDFEDAAKSLEMNKDLIDNLLNPISAPISD